MTSFPTELQGYLTEGIWHGAIVFLRVSAMMSVLPAFGERTVPVRVKLVLAIVFTAIIAPAVSPVMPVFTAGNLAFGAMAEIAVGLAFGMAIRLFVLALQVTGSIAAQSTSLSQILGGAAVDPMPAMGFVLIVAGLALAVMTGLHVQAARMLILTYMLVPAGQFPMAEDLSSWGVSVVAESFSLAFMLAAPFFVASMIYNLTLGVINRAMPQLMVAFVGAPLITAGGLFLLFAAAPVILSVWVEALLQFMSAPTGFSQ